jgi:plastocyanin
MAPNDVANEIWHSVTSCKSPCNRSTGISYPIADGDFQFDSGQMGTGGAPTVNRTTWSTPSYLPVGTHTFFCRIHPLMRGAIRVVPPKR